MDLDIVKSDIPLLTSKDMMKKMIMLIDLEDDTVLLEGKMIDVGTTESGIIYSTIGKGGEEARRFRDVNVEILH